MKTIVINERQEKILMRLMREEVSGLSDKVAEVKNYLDKHFHRARSSEFGKDGTPEMREVVVWVDDNNQIMKSLTDVQLFYVIQAKFKNILADRDERDKFLKQVIKDWYNKKISKENTLSSYI